MYNTIKNAKRAARKQGLAEGQFEIIEKDGGWIIERKAENEQNTDDLPTVDQPSPTAGAANLEDEKPADEKPAEPALQPILPEPTVPAAPVVETINIVMPEGAITPFAFIWAFLAANPTVPRKAQIAAMIAHGLNPNTVKTQVSRFNKVGGDKALWLASEKLKRDAEKAKIDAMVADIRARKEAEDAAKKAEAEAADNKAA